MRNTYKTIVESLEVCWDHQLAFLFCFLSCIFLLFYQSIEPFQFFLVYATSLFSKKNMESIRVHSISIGVIFILQDIKYAVHAHPTLSEVLDELFKSAKVSCLFHL